MTTAFAYPTSFFPSATNSSTGEEATVASIIDGIKTGRWQSKVAGVRKVVAEHGKDSSEYRAAKKLLPGFTPAGRFSPSRTKGNLSSPSGLVVIDLDNIPAENVEAIRERAAALPHTAAAFISPSALGIKVLAHVTPTPRNDGDFKAAWTQTLAVYRAHLDVEIDQTGKDCSRLCFVSFDPHCYVATSTEPMEWHEQPRRGPHSLEAEDPALLRSALAYIAPPQSYNDWLGWLATLMALNFTVQEAEEWSSQGGSYQKGEVAMRWAGLPDDDPQSAKDKLFGVASKLRWRRTGPNGTSPQHQPHVTLGRDYHMQIIASHMAHTLKTEFRFDLDRREWWQWRDGNHWETIQDSNVITDPLTNRRLAWAAHITENVDRAAGEFMADPPKWNTAISKQSGDWWARMRQDLGRPSPAPPDHLLGTPGGVVDLHDRTIEQHNPLKHDTLSVTRGLYLPEESDYLRLHLWGRLGFNISEADYDTLLKMMGLAASRKAQQLRALLWLYGVSGSGKGMTKNLIKAAWGQCAANVTLAMLERRQGDIDAELAELLERDPSIIVADELGGPGVKQSKFYAMTGNSIYMARRPYGKTISRVLRACWICPTVSPPYLNADEGLERRSAAIGFNHKFQGGRPNEDFDDEELAAIVTWAVIEASAVFEDGYEAPIGNTASREDLLREADSLRAFLEDLPAAYDGELIGAAFDLYQSDETAIKTLSLAVFAKKANKSERWRLEKNPSNRGQSILRLRDQNG